MRPLDPAAASILRDWIEKAAADLEAAERLVPGVEDSVRLRAVVGFHCQQAVEKFLKAFLTRYQIEFPKTHDIQALLLLVAGVRQDLAEVVNDARWLTPFGVETRYPGDVAEMLPGEEIRAIEIARRVSETVLTDLGME